VCQQSKEGFFELFETFGAVDHLCQNGEHNYRIFVGCLELFLWKDAGQQRDVVVRLDEVPDDTDNLLYF